MKQTLKFSKMHGLGNDFIVIDGVSEAVAIETLPIQSLSDRHTGIGFDQLLLITPSSKADFTCRIFNADGSEAEQCGNGMRCAGLFIQDNQLSDKQTLVIESKAGLTEIDLKNPHSIKVTLSIPKIFPNKHLKIGSHSLDLFIISMGNPHAITLVNALKDIPIDELGKQISTHKAFPEGTNAGFMEIVDRENIRLRTFERGAGATLACGSNACAAVVAGIENGLLDRKVFVELELGKLEIEWDGKDKPVQMSGPAVKVFEGEITPKKLN